MVFTLRLLNPWLLPLLTYLSLVVAGSLYPFAWHSPNPETYGFLWQAWPATITRTDILTNVLVYFPLGLFGAKVFFRRRLTLGRWLLISCAVALISLLLETVQLFLPARVASNVDLSFNALGGALGAAWAPVFSRHGRIFALLLALRRHWFYSGWRVHAGLILIALWIFAQLSLQAPSLVAGELHKNFYPFWEATSLSHFKFSVAAMFAVDLAALGLFASALMREERPRLAAAAVIIFLAILMKISAAALLVKFSALPRLLSLEVVIGMSIGLVSTLIFISARGGQIILQATAVSLGLLILVKLIHGAPFVTASGHMPDLALRPELLLNVTGLAFLVAEAWPYLTLGCVLALWERPAP